MASDEDRLTDALDALDSAERAVKSAIEDAREAMRAMASAHEDVVEDLKETIRSRELQQDDDLSAAKNAAHKVCDAVERPVGKMSFIVPRPEEFNRAVISLHDAIGRNI